MSGFKEQMDYRQYSNKVIPYDGERFGKHRLNFIIFALFWRSIIITTSMLPKVMLQVRLNLLVRFSFPYAGWTRIRFYSWEVGFE